jgi:hypothetical protein
MKPDRTVNLLLAAIALLLGALVLRPILDTTPQAQAADTTTASAPVHQMERIGTIKLPTSQAVKSIFVIDDAKSFGIQYADYVEIYAVNEVTKTVTEK